MGKQKEIRVSIIVPVYKAEEYLSVCVESILAQTFRNFELILVDDGSPDHCGEICDQYASRDSRIRVIHKKNGGVSSARNAGIEAATGEYLVFIDSDDYVEPQYLQDLIDAAADEKTLVIADYQPFRESGEEPKQFHEEFTAGLDAGSADPEDFRKLIFGFCMFPPYCKLYRRDVILDNEIRFDTQLRTAEDFDFNMRYLHHMECVHYIASVRYHYRIGYKEYIPSNRGILGQSEIKSVHTMAEGITALAKRMGLYDILEDEICLWAAKKHYFNRLRMLFAENPEISIRERYRLYRQLLDNRNYRKLHKRGIALVSRSTTKRIGVYCDWYPVWWLFYKTLHWRNARKTTEE